MPAPGTRGATQWCRAAAVRARCSASGCTSVFTVAHTTVGGRAFLVGAHTCSKAQNSVTAPSLFTVRAHKCIKVFLIGASACSPSVQKSFHGWRTSVPTLSAHKCSLLAHKCVRCRCAQVFLAGAYLRRTRALACSPSARKKCCNRRTSVFPVGARVFIVGAEACPL